jgi:hypothetical protein
VGHRLHKQHSNTAPQADLALTLPHVRAPPAVHAGYAVAYPAVYVQYRNGHGCEPPYYAQDPAQQCLPQAPVQAHSEAPMQQYQQYQHQDPAQQYQQQGTTAQQYQRYEHQAPAQAQPQSASAPPSATPRAADPRAHNTYSSPPGQLAFPPAGHYSAGPTYGLASLSPPVYYGNRSSPTYESQPHFAQSLPQNLYGGAYMVSQPQMGYFSAAHVYQPQQQGPSHSQCAYAYTVQCPSTSPTHSYPEIGLCAQSFSSDCATAGNAASAPMSPQQVPVSTPQASYVNVYMAPPAPQQHAGYQSSMTHVAHVQAPTMYNPPQRPATTRQVRMQSPRYMYSHVGVASAAANARDCMHEVSPRVVAHTVSCQGPGRLLQVERGERGSEPQAQRSPSAYRRGVLPCSCKQMDVRLEAGTGLAPTLSPAPGSQHMQRSPQVGGASGTASAPPVIAAGCALL